MNTDLILSIVIPNFNCAKYLQELLCQLTSLRNKDKIEIILMDGGSTDGSVETAKRYLRHTDVLVSEPDDGQADAIHKGLMRARGRWFIFQNSDDIFEGEVLDCFLESARKYERFDVLAFNMSTLHMNGGRWETLKVFKHTRSIAWQQLYYNIYFTNQATLYRTRDAQKIGFNKSFNFALDYDFVVRFFKLETRNMLVIDQFLGHQRLHEDTKTSRMQDICLSESKQIRRREFGNWDRLVGFVHMLCYHAGKRL